ncbi:austinoid biosynthesis cluster protein W-like isoform X6 [Athalia rosae]|uniref:austinoid biosynthesis cluster protein W-like isoform X6 n=1 Tax=Athalia rosae TaxID=37344 RepID=UPI002033C64C|nr:austinoid biosynthesis cluster protein W-like isoform X6 [Athalia rosae]
MGVKWTCALFCLLGIVSLPVEGIQRQNMRERRDLRNAFESPSMTRKKRDVSHVLQDQGPQNGPNPAAFQNPGSFARSGSSSFASGSASGTFGNSATGFDGVGSYPGYSGAGSGPFYRGGSSFGSAGQPWSQSGSFNGFPGQNSYRPSGYYPNNNAFVQEYFRQLEEQQRQFESQFRGPQQPFFGLNNRLGNGPPNFNDQYTPNNFGFGTRGGFNAGSNFPNSANTGQRFPNTGFGGSNTFGKPTVGNGAHAYANIGPNGGTYGAEFTPGTPGILNRFKETVPPPNGQSYATFTSTSKTHSRDSDGNEINEEVATVGVNDNGNITLKTIRNPPIPNN